MESKPLTWKEADKYLKEWMLQVQCGVTQLQPLYNHKRWEELSTLAKEMEEACMGIGANAYAFSEQDPGVLAEAMRYTEEETAALNKTCRSQGAIGKRAKVPRLVVIWAKLSDRILDYGAGKDALHAIHLRNLGYKVDAYDIGKNFNQCLHISLGELYAAEQYDCVYASNVLNVQPNREGIDNVLDQCHAVLKPGGMFIFNYPKTPRKSSITEKELVSITAFNFTGGTNTASCRKIGDTAYMVIKK